jgi:hypothetical protein
MRAPQMRSAARRAYAEHCASRASVSGSPDSTTPAEPPDFAVIYVANRYRLPMHVAALVARLADIGRTL